MSKLDEAKAKLQAAVDELESAEHDAAVAAQEDPAVTAAKAALADQFAHIAHRSEIIDAIHALVVAVVASIPADAPAPAAGG